MTGRVSASRHLRAGTLRRPCRSPSSRSTSTPSLHLGDGLTVRWQTLALAPASPSAWRRGVAGSTRPVCVRTTSCSSRSVPPRAPSSAGGSAMSCVGPRRSTRRPPGRSSTRPSAGWSWRWRWSAACITAADRRQPARRAGRPLGETCARCRSWSCSAPASSRWSCPAAGQGRPFEGAWATAYLGPGRGSRWPRTCRPIRHRLRRDRHLRSPRPARSSPGCATSTATVAGCSWSVALWAAARVAVSLTWRDPAVRRSVERRAA